MLYSMTGFGTATVLLPNKKIVVDVKSLNSKQLDLNCRVPSGLRAVEPQLRGLVSAKLERGKADLTVSIENIGMASSARINGDVLSGYMKQIKALAAENGLPLPADWFSVLLRLPEVITAVDDTHAEIEKDILDAVCEATSKALDALMDYRRAEGEKLEEFFEVRIERIRSLLAEVPRYENERLERIRLRMTDALSKIPAVEYDRGRFEQEMIYYIEKLDINEEKQRLTQHLDYFLETMRDDNARGRGKKLGFIAQEMTREINTLGSKSNHAEMQNIVVMMKDELEQIKEQVLNVM